MRRHLTKEELFKMLNSSSGLIPIDIDLDEKHLIWTDFESYHCYEGFFHKSLDSFAALKTFQTGNELVTFTTDKDVLEDNNILRDYIYPTAFIFHAGRCGSTLLAKILARSRDNMVFSEASPHNKILSLLSQNGNVEINDKNRSIYKNLLLAMARKRLQSHETHFIKFTSYNILFFEFINNVFPDVPAVFLYRDPVRVLSSFQKNSSGWVSSQDKFIRTLISDKPEESTMDFAAKALISFFRTALSAKINLLNYNQLTHANFSTILNYLNLHPSKEQLALMDTQFSFNSKTEHQKREFFAETKEPVDVIETISTSLREELIYLYEKLQNSELNIVTTR